MRHRIVFVLSAALVFAGGGVVQADEPVQNEKIMLSFAKTDEMVRTLAGKVGMPKGIDVILGYPRDRSLLVKGRADAIRTLKDAVSVGDVAIRSESPEIHTATLTFAKTKPALVDKLREAILSLPGSGTAKVDGSRLAIRGKLKWVNEAIAAAMLAEMAASGIELTPPSAPQEFSAIRLGAAAPAPWITVTVPAGIDVTVQSDTADYKPIDGEGFFTGSPKLKVAGFEMRVRGQLRMTGGKPGQATVIQVLSSESLVQMTLPASPEVMIQSEKVLYHPEARQLETTGELTVRLPKSVLVKVRGGKAASSTMRKGEAFDLTIIHEVPEPRSSAETS